MIEFDASEGRFVLNVLDKLSGLDLFEPLDEIGARFIARVRLGFRDSTDPYGNEWRPITHREGRPLDDTGALKKSFVHMANLNGVLRIGSPLDYAAKHNEGLGRIHKRQIIPGDELPPSWADDINNVMDSYLQEIADNAAR